MARSVDSPEPLQVARAAEDLQLSAVDSPPPVQRAVDPPVVQRDPDPAPAPAPAPEAAAAPAPETDELVKKLFDPLLRRLKTELRLDRERRGALTDRPH